MTGPNYSAADYQAALQALLPRGRVWPRDPDSVQAQVLDGLSRVYAATDGAATDLLIDAFPTSAVNLLPEWEETLALPDACLGGAPTLMQRQASIRARLLQSGGDSIAYYKAYGSALGFPVDVEQFAPFRMGLNGMGDPIGDEDWFFVWQINTLGRLAVIQCELAQVTPAHTVLTVNVVPNFNFFLQSQITPSDATVLSPRPYGGLYFPNGGTVALEGETGIATTFRFLPGSWFYGLIPKRVRATGTDAEILIYRLDSAALTELQSLSGDRQYLAVPSDTPNFPASAAGGVYFPEGGNVRFRDEKGVITTKMFGPDTWYHDTPMTQIFRTGSDPDITAWIFAQ